MGIGIDLCSPAICLAVCHCLLQLANCASVLREELRNSVAAILAETSSHCLVPWRVDTETADDANSPNAIIDWILRGQEGLQGDPSLATAELEYLSSSTSQGVVLSHPGESDSYKHPSSDQCPSSVSNPSEMPPKTRQEST